MGAFKPYDIRGVYGTEVTPELAGKAAAWFAELFHIDNVVLGNDVRVSSPFLKKSAIKGLIGRGCDIVDIGLTTTPSVGLYVIKEKLDGGIMITASHNPPEHNGMKLYGAKGIDFTYETGIAKIESSLKKKLPKASLGSVKNENYREQYENHIISLANQTDSLKVAIDAGNGCCSEIGPKIHEEIGNKVTKLFCSYDGRFPNHFPDPSDEKNLEVLKKEVKKKNLDIGIAYDGDGDRAAFVDEKGNYVRSDDILRILVRYFAKKGDKIAYTINCSMALQEEIDDMGAKGMETRIGRSYIRALMTKEKAILGGEMSGHLFFKDNYYLDDGIVASLKVAEIVSEH